MTQADEFPEQRYWPPVLSSLAFKHGTIMVRVMAYNRTVKEGDEVPVNDLAAFFKWREREAEAKEEPPLRADSISTVRISSGPTREALWASFSARFGHTCSPHEWLAAVKLLCL